MRAISVCNYKGGVGKTTTATNLAVVLAQLGRRVLLVDCDPTSCSATQFLGFAHLVDTLGTYGTADFVLGKGDFSPLSLGAVPGLDLLPATAELPFLEAQLFRDVIAGPRRLQHAVQAIAHRYDFVIADCAPHYGLLTQAALAACPEVLIPVELTPASAIGVIKLRDHLNQLRLDLAPRLSILGVLGTFFRPRERLSREVLDNQLAPIFPRGPGGLFDTVIHERVAAAAAAGDGAPIVLADPTNPVAEQYVALTQEVVSREA